MRPLRLHVKGFTAFRDPAEIDFTNLEVFAIAGPTGSGKSSLLDAMTYALYGRVERVGDRVSQLVSQGQPRMAVTLDFAVGRHRYRVTRSTPAARGATKILLERQDREGEWRQAGEGADRVRDAERMIVRAVGLPYDHFTRTILLPQGKFAEFLVGDPRKRREILTELLGLSVFRHMAQRAGAIAGEAGVRAQERTAMLEREYADATIESVRAARREAKGARKRERDLAEAAERVLAILERWREAERSVEDLRASLEHARRAADAAGTVTGEIVALGGELARANETVARLAEAERAAGAEAERAAQAVLEAATSLGSPEELAAAHLTAQSLREAVAARQAKGQERAAAEADAATLAAAARAAAEAVAQARASVESAEEKLREAEEAAEEARHADLVATVSAGLKAGDPCPVCGIALTRAPRRPGGGSLERASKALEKARRGLKAVEKERVGRERASEAAAQRAGAATAERERLSTELEDLSARITAAKDVLRSLLGDPLPPDATSAVEERVAERRRLETAERTAVGAAAEATKALLASEQERDRTAGEVALRRERLAVDHAPLFERAAGLLPAPPSPIPDPPPDTDDVEELQRYGAVLAESLHALAARLDAELAARSSVESRLLAEGNEAVGRLLPPRESLTALAETVNAAVHDATAEAATSEQRAATLAGRLDRKTQLAEEAAALEARATVFRQLAQELRADRLIAFLQSEALELLASAGSARLAALSDGRYRIVCRDDEFVVVDTWNGDEERSVRTLSGGETFLASLSLALALAEQTPSLAVEGRARIDSLFLDEGFGTLDQETLRVVVDAIEQLAGDGRLVGVITHVPELAEQFPRIQVEKSPRGSSLQLVP